MRRGWTKFSRCTSLVVLVAALSVYAFPAQRPNSPKNTNELTLAGLRPGRDPVTNAFKRYKQKYLVSKTNADSKEWRDTCTGRSLALAVDSQSVIQEITVSLLVPRDGNCDNRRFEFLNLDDWVRFGISNSVRYFGPGTMIGTSSNVTASLDWLRVS